MYVQCRYVAGFEGVLGKEMEMMDRNGGGSMFIFCDGRVEADWRSCATPTLRKVGVKTK
jgi:prepilin-type processing-associated H-X9-DG protein